ncbi:MAG TPA: dephospho-CoA kinase [Clostridiales bacterium]|jgi:dephospho-CoA kinase|nr:dephospho-CoA kinase [Clostridiales bacterium]
MILLGITGQSGTGTTTVGKILASTGVLFINADEVYHRLLAEDDELNSQLEKVFGAEVMENGRVNRKALASVVFSDPAALERLNSIAHGRVLKEIRTILAQNPGQDAAVEAIALFESGFAEECTHTVALTAPLDIRLARIMERDELSEEAAKARLAAQKDASFYTLRAQYVIENTNDLSALQEKVLALWNFIKQEPKANGQTS